VKNILNLGSGQDGATRGVALRPPLLGFVADAQSETVLRECLQQLSVQNSTVVRGGITKCIQYLYEERSPNVLIVDISGIDLPLSEIHRLAEVCEPGVTVIAIGDRNDIGLYRDLQQAGISDYIVKPLTPYIIAKSVQAAMEGQRVARISEKLAKLVAVVGARGGVGATSISVNLAWHLANRQNRRVALLDLDLQNGDCGIMLSIKPTSGLREAFENPIRLDSIFVERAMTLHGERLFILDAEESLADDVQITNEGIEALMGVLRSQFHYLIVDIPRVTGPAFRKVLQMADVRVIVLDPTLRAIRDTVRIRELFPEDAEHRNMLVVNRNGEGGKGAMTVQEIESALEVHPKVVIPFLPRLFSATLSKGQIPAEAQGSYSHAIGELAADISGRTREQRRGWRFWK
jgi:pilus assembly protein CpaE